MQVETGEKSHNFIYDFFRNTSKEDLNYVYRGKFNQSITDSILSLAERNIDENEEPKIKKRLYFILVESLQNITRYQTVHEESFRNSGIFMIQKKGIFYFITTGNLIDNQKIDFVRQKLTEVNKMTEEELKLYYKTVLKNGNFTEKGGAGLGMIEIARKSGNKLHYDFKKINEDCSYFYFHTFISSSRPERISSEIYNPDEVLRYVMNIHEVLNKEQIYLVFNSGFSRETMLILTSILEGQMMEKGRFKKRLFHLMVEMLQNIIHHGVDQNGEEVVKPGIFYINEFEDEFVLNAGNYISTQKVEFFQTRLNEVNALEDEELDELYNRKLLEQNEGNFRKTGLGIIDMRIKSEKSLKFHFQSVNSDYSFFTMQVSIEKNG